MKVNILTLKGESIPAALKQIPHAPKQLFWAGLSPDDLTAKPRVAIVGSRRATSYGRNVTEDFARQLAGNGIAIISGLAYGIDYYAHSAALKTGGCTAAILPSPIEKIYPAAHYHLAQQMIQNGGALISEYQAGTDVQDFNFINRNRLVSGLADVLLITEATKQSGTMHTARFALEQGKTVMAVPGSINSATSEGCNNLIKSGAIPTTSVEDVFFALNLKPTRQPIKIFQGTPNEQCVLDLIHSGIQDQEQLALTSKLPTHQVSSTLTSLELQGYIRPLGGGNWTIS